MQRLGNAAAIAIGCVSLLGACYHELLWRRLLARGQKVSGLIIADIEDSKTVSHQIEFEFQGKTHRFVSEDENISAVVGASVLVLIDPQTGRCTTLSWS